MWEKISNVSIVVRWLRVVFLGNWLHGDVESIFQLISFDFFLPSLHPAALLGWETALLVRCKVDKKKSFNGGRLNLNLEVILGIN